MREREREREREKERERERERESELENVITMRVWDDQRMKEKQFLHSRSFFFICVKDENASFFFCWWGVEENKRKQK